MNIEAKCRILADAWMIYRNTDDEGWAALISACDLAFPFAFGVRHGFVSLNEGGIPLIEDCWNDACTMMRIDPEGTYSDYSEWIDASPNDFL